MRERRFRVYKEAPGFRSVHRVMTREQARGDRAVLSIDCKFSTRNRVLNDPPARAKLPDGHGELIVVRLHVEQQRRLAHVAKADVRAAAAHDEPHQLHDGVADHVAR